jgi:hypothetical protein
VQKYEKNTIEAVIRVLLLTLYADDRHQPPEKAEVRRQLPNLEIFTDGIFFGPFSKVDSYIDKHDREMQDLIAEYTLGRVIEETLARVDDVELIPNLYNAMLKVAQSDGEVVIEENLLIGRALVIWGWSPDD